MWLTLVITFFWWWKWFLKFIYFFFGTSYLFSKSAGPLFVFGRFCIVMFLLFVTLIYLQVLHPLHGKSPKCSFYWKLHVSVKDSCVTVFNVPNCFFIPPLFKFIFFSPVKMIVSSKDIALIDCWLSVQSKILKSFRNRNWRNIWDSPWKLWITKTASGQRR